MPISSERIALIPVPIPTQRGVHAYDQPSGETIYLAVTSAGALLNGEIRRRQRGETEENVQSEMWADLNQQDAVTSPPLLGLYVDGVRRR